MIRILGLVVIVTTMIFPNNVVGCEKLLNEIKEDKLNRVIERQDSKNSFGVVIDSGPPVVEIDNVAFTKGMLSLLAIPIANDKKGFNGRLLLSGVFSDNPGVCRLAVYSLEIRFGEREDPLKTPFDFSTSALDEGNWRQIERWRARILKSESK